jgi:hypothetical protein
MSVKQKPSAPAPLLRNVGTAPVIYFDSVPVFGAGIGGNIEVELGMRVMLPRSDGGVISECMCTAHLRCTTQAASLLAQSIQQALKLLEQQQADLQKAAQEAPAQLHS